MQSKNELLLRENTEMDLSRTQLSLMGRYGNPHSAAVAGTLTGGRRHKSPKAAAKGEALPWGLLLQETEPILLLFARFLGTGPEQADSAMSAALVLHTHTAVRKCPGTDTHPFHCSRFQVFQQVAFSFQRSIHMNSAGPLLQQPSC